MSGNEKLIFFIERFFIAWSALFTLVFSEKLGDGCGHSVLGQESGVLTSRNYPSTYPNDTWCEWRIRAGPGGRLALRLGDLDLEEAEGGCDTNYIRVLEGGGGAARVLRTFCGRLKNQSRELLLASGDVTVQFRSGRHISGRGFLLSYSTGEGKDLLTCLDKGIHFSASMYRKYCPAGCQAVVGEVSGDISQGYRDTSVLCKAAVHAGVILDQHGGPIAVESQKGLSHYPATRANGIQSRDGSLSATLFTFVTSDCKKQTVLQPVAVTASPGWLGAAESDWVPNKTQPGTAGPSWAADLNYSQPWLLLDLGEKKRITGILTTGSGLHDSSHYVRSYRVGRGRTYLQQNGTGDEMFEGNQDGLHPSRNTFHPAVVARYLRIVPDSWHQRIAMRVELLGCPHIKVNPSAQVTLEATPTKPKPKPREVDQETPEPVPFQTDIVTLVIIIVPTVLAALLLLLGICVFKRLQKRKSKETPYSSSVTQQTGCWKQMKQPFARHQSTEFTISYSSEKDPMQSLDLVTSTMAEYQQPLMIGLGTVSRKGSTFRPIDADPKDEPDDPSAHYDHLHTANQYALPLTNQEPEYATPIVERHSFRKDTYPADPNYSVPGTVLGKTPSFSGADRKAGVGAPLPGVYQTPQVKAERVRGSEGVYDSPKVSKLQPATQNGGALEYRRPQGKSSSTLAPEGYSAPRDRVRVGQRPDPEGSSGGS